MWVDNKVLLDKHHVPADQARSLPCAGGDCVPDPLSSFHRCMSNLLTASPSVVFGFFHNAVGSEA
jgi:hypothetical protein